MCCDDLASARPLVSIALVAMLTTPITAVGVTERIADQPLAVGTDAEPADERWTRAREPTAASPSDVCIPHPPIHIQGDWMFRLGPTVGVVNPWADGTEEDPFVIEGWCIAPLHWDPGDGFASHTQEAGILLEETAAHVLIRGNVIDGAPLHTPPSGSEPETLGIELRETDHVTISNNTLTDFPEDAVRTYQAAQTVIEGNTIEGTDGIVVGWSSGTVITGNALLGNYGAVGLLLSEAANISENRIEGNLAGVDLSRSQDVRITENLISGNTRGGIFVSGTLDAVVQRNNIQGNGHDGLEVHGGTGTVDARHNWWGHASGPNGGSIDAVTGTEANGDGDAIRTPSGGEVRFDPWLTRPNPQAGIDSVGVGEPTSEGVSSFG